MANPPMKPKSPMIVCGAKNRRGNPCQQAQGWGTDHVGFGNCKLHGGASPSGVKHAEKERALWQQFLIDELDPSLRVIRQLRDGEDVAPRDRIKAASWLVEQARSLVEGGGGELVLRIRWPD